MSELKVIASYPFSTSYGHPIGEVLLRQVGVKRWRLSTTYFKGGNPTVAIYEDLGIALGTYWATVETVKKVIKETFG